MFVHFLYELLTTPHWGPGSYIWAFEKSVNFSITHKGAVIAQKTYFDLYRQKEENISLLDQIKSYEIPAYIDEQVLATHGDSNLSAWLYMLKHNYEPLFKWLESVINEITSAGEIIEAFVLNTPCYSLEKVALKYNIPLMQWDDGPMRLPVYKEFFLFFDFTGVQLAKNEASQRYHLFQDEMDGTFTKYVLTQKEILALILSDDYLCKIEDYDQEPSYEWGIALNFDTVYAHAYNNTYLLSEFLYDVMNNIDITKSLTRSHPADWFTIKNSRWAGSIDESPDSESFILQCRRIVTSWSKTAFLAMMWGRYVHMIKSSQHAFIEGASQSFDTNKSKLADIAFISFITFAYFIPNELLYDIEYLRWRLTKPSEIEIYMRNLSYYLGKIGMDIDFFLSIPNTDIRLDYLLCIRQYKQKNTYQTQLEEKVESTEKLLETYDIEITELKSTISMLTDELSKQISNISVLTEELSSKTSNISVLTEELSHTSSHITVLKDELSIQNSSIASLKIETANLKQRNNDITSSHSWRITKPLRWFKQIILRWR